MSRIVLWALQLGPFLIGSSVARPSVAQSDSERAMARAAADAGDVAFKEGRYEEAADYFSRAESIMHAPTLLLHLARSQAKLGRFVLARESYIKVSREVLAADAPAAFRSAQDTARSELLEVEKKIAHLTIRVGGPAPEAVRVSIDGQPIPSAVIGLPYPADPGSRAIEVSAEGYDPKRLEVALNEGGRRELAVTLRPLSEASTASATHGESAAALAGPPPHGAGDDGSAPPSTGSALRTGAYVAFGVGLVGASLGTLFLVQRGSALGEADDRYAACAGGRPACTDADAQRRIRDLDDEAASKGTLAIVSYAAGGAGVAAGVILFLVSGSSEPRTAAIVPYFGGRDIGLLGSF